MLIVTLIGTGLERNDELYMYSVYIVTLLINRCGS